MAKGTVFSLKVPRYYLAWYIAINYLSYKNFLGSLLSSICTIVVRLQESPTIF